MKIGTAAIIKDITEQLDQLYTAELIMVEEYIRRIKTGRAPGEQNQGDISTENEIDANWKKLFDELKTTPTINGFISSFA